MNFPTLEQRMVKIAGGESYVQFQMLLGMTDHDIHKAAMISGLITEIKWEIDAAVIKWLQDTSQLPFIEEVGEDTFKLEIATRLSSMSQEIDRLVEVYLPSFWNYIVLHKRKATW